MSGLGLVLGCGVRVMIRVNVKVSLVFRDRFTDFKSGP